MGGCCSSHKPKSTGKEHKRPGNLEYKSKAADESIEIQDAEAELNDLFNILQDKDGNITAQQCKELIESLQGKFTHSEIQAMLLKIDDCWWGQQGKTKISKSVLKQILSSKQAKSETNSSKVENTQESLISPRQRMNGLEKCSVCSKMLKDSKEGEVFWLDTCNDYYHVECLRNY